MRRFLALSLTILLVPAASGGQPFPVASTEGNKALDQLLAACVAGGGLREVREPKSGSTHLVLADAAKVAAAVTAKRTLLSPALADALVARLIAVQVENHRPPLVAVLRAVAAETRNDRLRAYAAFYLGLAADQTNRAAALREFQEARRLFAGLKYDLWEAACLQNLGSLYSAQGDHARALTSYRRALPLKRKALGDHADVAFTLYSIAWAHESLKDTAQAMAHYQQALALYRKVGVGPHPTVAQIHQNLAFLHTGRKEYARALEQDEQALTIRRRLPGDHRADVAFTLNHIGWVHAELEQYPQAMKYYQQALAIRRQLPAAHQADLALTLQNIGVVHGYQKEYAKAEAFHRQALAIRLKVLGENHLDTAYALHNVGWACSQQGKNAEALTYYGRAVAIRRKVPGADPVDLAQSLHNMGIVSSELKDYVRALKYYRQALAIRRQFPAGYLADTAYTLSNMAWIYREQGDFAQALVHYRQALAARRQAHGENHADVAGSYLKVGNVLTVQGEYAEALAHFQAALRVLRRLGGAEDEDAAACLNNIGYLCSLQGEYGKALEFYQQALGIVRKVHGEEHADFASCLNNIGTIYNYQGDFAQGLSYYRRALAIRRKVVGEESTDVGDSLNNLGCVYAWQGEFARAADHCGQALAIKRRIHGDLHPDVAACRNDLGYALAGRGEIDNALKQYREALAIWRGAYGEHHPDVALAWRRIGELEAARGDNARALKAWSAALEVLGQTRKKPPTSGEEPAAKDLRPLLLTVDVLQQRGLTLEKTLGRAPTAARLRACARTYQLATDVLERVRREVLQSEASKVFHGDTQFELFPRRVGLCGRLFALEGKPEDLEAAFVAAEQGTARAFLEQLGRARAHQVGKVSDELRREETRLLLRLRELDGRLARPRLKPTNRAERLARLFDERERVEADLQKLLGRMAKEYPQYAALKYPRPCSLAQARACLGPGEVALLYVPGSEQSHVIVVEGQPAPQDRARGLAVYPLAPAADLADLVAALTDPEALALPARARELAAKGYRLLLAPLADRIRGKTLVIVPGGELCHLPFELLVEGEAEQARYLVEAHPIRYAPSLTVLHLVRAWAQGRTNPPDRSLWAMGDPVYDQDDERLGDRALLARATRETGRELRQREGRARDGRTFPRLKHSGREVADVARLLHAADEDVRTGPDAREAAVKRVSESGRLARYRYVHFATHGILGLGEGQLPALVLSLVGNDGREDALGTNDGFLRLDEVTRLKLNADLVVLSACRTGRGTLHNGEGVSGLARAFLYAGSRGVVCSLWSVDDQETANLMVQMYRNLKRGQPSADALRNAQLEMIKAGKAPLYWAPFILIGE